MFSHVVSRVCCEKLLLVNREPDGHIIKFSSLCSWNIYFCKLTSLCLTGGVHVAVSDEQVRIWQAIIIAGKQYDAFAVLV